MSLAQSERMKLDVCPLDIKTQTLLTFVRKKKSERERERGGRERSSVAEPKQEKGVY